jgi:hypothetical protein
VTVPRLRGLVAWLAVVVGVALVVVTQPAGLWWMPLVAGFALGVLLRGRRAWLGALLTGALGWGLPLLWQARTEPVGAVAGVLGRLLGIPAAVALAVTVLVGVVLALAGVWVGVAARRLVSRKGVAVPPPSSTSDGS